MHISRSERQVRNLSRGLFCATVVLVGLCIAMTAKFGWGMSVDAIDRVIYAIAAATIDVVGALLMTGCGVLFARKQRAAGALLLVLAGGCTAVSAAAIFGYQSSNRIAVAKTREKIAQLDAVQLNWLKDLAVNPTVKNEKQAASEKQAMIGEVKEQLKTMKGAEATLEPDTQASELAAAFHQDEPTMRRYLTMGSSGMLLFCQFACLWLYGFLRHRIEPETAAQGRENSNLPHGTSPGSSGAFPHLGLGRGQFRLVPQVAGRIGKFREEQALADLQRRLGSGEEPLAKDLAVAWRRPVNTTSKWITKWEAAGLISRKRRGNEKLIRAGSMGLQMTGTA